MKMRLLIFWALSQHGLASEDGIIFQISMYNWIAFSDTCITIANQVRLKYNLD